MPTNNPCATTPVIFLSSAANSAASLISPSPLRSRMRLPLSVTNGVSSPPRTTRLTPRSVNRSAVKRHRKGSTSTGSTPTPRRLTSFDSSTTTTKRFAAAAPGDDGNPPRSRKLGRIPRGRHPAHLHAVGDEPAHTFGEIARRRPRTEAHKHPVLDELERLVSGRPLEVVSRLRHGWP